VTIGKILHVIHSVTDMYSLEYKRINSSILRYYCILKDDKLLYYYLSEYDAIMKLKELQNER